MAWCIVILMHVTTNDGSGRTGVTPERMFGDALRAARRESGLSQSSVADQMRARGFTRFDQSKVSGIEKGSRPLRMNEAVALARILGADLLGMFVASIAEDRSHAESAVIAERLAYSRLVRATGRVQELIAGRDRIDSQLAEAQEQLAEAEWDWQQARRQLAEAAEDPDGDADEDDEGEGA